MHHRDKDVIYTFFIFQTSFSLELSFSADYKGIFESYLLNAEIINIEWKEVNSTTTKEWQIFFCENVGKCYCFE